MIESPIYKAHFLSWFSSAQLVCQFITIGLHFFYMSIFSWMLVEGIHLYRQIVAVFDSEKSRIWVYFAVGWGKSRDGSLLVSRPLHTLTSQTWSNSILGQSVSETQSEVTCFKACVLPSAISHLFLAKPSLFHPHRFEQRTRFLSQFENPSSGLEQGLVHASDQGDGL